MSASPACSNCAPDMSYIHSTMSPARSASSCSPRVATASLGCLAGGLLLMLLALNVSGYVPLCLLLVAAAFGYLAFHYTRLESVFFGGFLVGAFVAIAAGVFDGWSQLMYSSGLTLSSVERVLLNSLMFGLLTTFGNVITGLIGFGLGESFGKKREYQPRQPLVTCCLTCARTRPGDLTEICPECGWVLKPNCGVCGYLRDGLASDLCPECGSAWQRQPPKPWP